jgi:hypothetical protein
VLECLNLTRGIPATVLRIRDGKEEDKGPVLYFTFSSESEALTWCKGKIVPASASQCLTNFVNVEAIENHFEKWDDDS